jgi:hypothetical protein
MLLIKKTSLTQDSLCHHCMHNNRQRGAALAETILALLPLLMLASLGLELARGYQVRQLLTLALHETARVAAVHQADPLQWQPALNRALIRLSLVGAQHQQLQLQHQFGMPLWHAEQLLSAHNTIHLRLTYLHRPMQEWLRLSIKQIYRSTYAWQGVRSRSASAWKEGLIPIEVQYRVLRHRSDGKRI